MSASSSPGFRRQARWRADAVGSAIGILSWAVFALVDKPLGVKMSLTGRVERGRTTTG